MFKTAIKAGITHAARQWRLTTFVYVVQLTVVLLLSLQVFQVLEASIGNSLQINALAKGYNHTVLADFLKVHGASLTPLLGQLRWFLLVWLVLGSYLQGGLLSRVVKSETTDVGGFLADASRCFFPFLAMSLLSLFVAVLCVVLLVGGVLLQFQNLIEQMESEKGFLAWLGVALFVWILLLLSIYAMTLLAKLAYLRGESSLRTSYKQAWRWFSRQPLLYIGYSVVAAALVFLFWFIFQWLAGPLYWSNPVVLCLLGLLQQGFVWLRIWLRQALYAVYHLSLNH